jgi:hypothetical protein
MATEEIFINATGNGLNSKNMRDRECINRFAGFFQKGWQSYQGNMESFLNQILREMNQQGFSKEQLTEHFLNSMQINFEIFGEHSFRKSLSSGYRRSVVNVALFDVLSCIFATWPLEAALSAKIQIREVITRLIEDDDFAYAITSSTNSKRSVFARFKMTEEALAPLRP